MVGRVYSALGVRDYALRPPRFPWVSWMVGGGCITGPGHDGALNQGAQRREDTMNRLSRRQFLRASGTVVGATIVPSLALSHRVGAAEKALIPKKMPFPPNDEFGSYEPTITPDGNTIYFARFAGGGDKRVLGTTTDIFVTHRIRQSGEWPGTGADWTPPERRPDAVTSASIDQKPRITPNGKRLYSMSRRSATRISGSPTSSPMVSGRKPRVSTSTPLP